MFLLSSQAQRNKDLRQAAAAGDIKAVQRSLRRGANPRAPNPHGMTALHIAAAKHHVRVAQTLLTCSPPLHGSTTPRQLIGLPSKDSHGATALHICVSRFDADGALLQTFVPFLGPQLVNSLRRHDNGSLPLHEASQHGNCHAVKVLLAAAGADVYARRLGDGATALFLASCHGHKDVVQVLLKWDDDTQKHSNNSNNNNDDVDDKKNIHQPNAQGKTPFYIAVEKGHAVLAWKYLQPHMVRGWLPQQGHHAAQCLLQSTLVTKFTPLHEACKQGNVPLVRRMLAWLLQETCITAEHFINLGDADGWTPLHVACYNGHARICQDLCSVGARLDCANADGHMPLDMAVAHSVDLTYTLLRNYDPDLQIWKCSVHNKSVKPRPAHDSSTQVADLPMDHRSGNTAGKKSTKPAPRILVHPAIAQAL